MITISLESDMWFEIADHLRDRLTDMEYLSRSNDFKDNPDFQRRYIYLKTIVEKLEYELTH